MSNNKDAAPLFANAYALLIGATAEDLKAPERDAVELYKVLADEKRGKYAPQNIELIPGEKATADGIGEGFFELIKKTGQKEASTTIIYYSGHGGVINSKYYLQPYGYDSKRLEETAISGTQLSNWIHQVRSRKLLIILDCCYAGGFPLLAKSALPEELVAGLEAGTGRVAIASSQESEKSLAYPDFSFFTESLINALKGGAARHDQYIRILEVISYLFRDVPARTGDAQNPVIKGIQNLNDNFALCLAPEDRRMESAAERGANRLLSLDEFEDLTSQLRAEFRIKNFYRDQLNDRRVQQTLEYQNRKGAKGAKKAAAAAGGLDPRTRELETLYLKSLETIHSLRGKIKRGWRAPRLLARFSFDNKGKIRCFKESDDSSKKRTSYEIRLFIENFPSDLKSVTYELDSSYPDRKREASDPSKQFEEFITSYGEFQVRAFLQFENGTKLKIVRWLSSILQDHYQLYPPEAGAEKAVNKAIEEIEAEYFE